jgi:hypothetical protein
MLLRRPGDGWMVQFLSPAPQLPLTNQLLCDLQAPALPSQFSQCNRKCNRLPFEIGRQGPRGLRQVFHVHNVVPVKAAP